MGLDSATMATKGDRAGQKRRLERQGRQRRSAEWDSIPKDDGLFSHYRKHVGFGH